MSADTSYDARTGEVVEHLEVSTPSDVAAALAAAESAAPLLASAPPAQRRAWLDALADALAEPATAEALVGTADRETALGDARLRGELARCASQLRFYGEVAAEGSYLDVAVDHAAPLSPELRRMAVPLGPVAVLGASNFPFAFGALGSDTASALAAGCPVLAKAHPAHPVTSRLLGEVAIEALAAAGAPQGTFAVLSGFASGQQLVRAPETRAVAFTGSQGAGTALWRLANDREVVIPVYAEMGTINPVVMTPGALDRVDAVAAGFVASMTLGMGQFCTKPGLLLVPSGHDVPSRVAQALVSASPSGWMLTGAIAAAVRSGVDELCEAGAEVLAQVPAAGSGWSAPTTVLRAGADAVRAGSRLTQECFGPVALVVEYDDLAQLGGILAGLQGALAGSVMTGGPQDPDTAQVVSLVAPLVGRVCVDDWPTGVAFSWAQQHGGPWPATTVPSATSVGAAALHRFTRPVTWQSVPDPALPSALRDDNPWRVPRRVDGIRVEP